MKNHLPLLFSKRTILPIFLLIILAACSTENGNTVEERETDSSAEAIFIAKPEEVPEQVVKTLELGMKAPDFKLPGTDGKFHALSDYDDKKVIAIVFTCNHCPTAQAYEERLKKIASDYSDQSFQLITISPNSPIGVLYEELGYSDLGDSYEDMKIRDEVQDFNFPYLYDGDNQKVSLAYGPAATPHCFVFDEERILQYVGRIDASEEPGTANAEDLRNAIEKLLANKAIAESSTKTFGCSTKWGWKTSLRIKADEDWKKKEVNLLECNLDELSKLVKNDSEKLRLINVWASWCAPCRIEYPEFIVIQRMFGARDFEFISVSADKMTKKDDALKFLKSAHSAVPNYIVTNDDKYALIEAIDPEWNGALPYTLLIEPGGIVVWQYQGEVDFQKLKRVIVDHPMIGRVY